ncbi:hypothetical protein J4E90_005582 [Alternaria incomplexa]|uniref:uncharacterized protein n=1 Tax=Alternaria incomplexa TaxID=1187928 RepID=UPI00221FE3C9|nr:uncharacterized protein J4E90_005582 [Alternaria incomplexa]KAI4913862.1 hypothetical protein J4E90_005582 [Alternaria incomplexa]
MRTDYKPEEVRTEVLPLFDSKTFWKQLSYKAQTRLLPKLVPKPLNVTSPTKKKLPVDRALAVKFPVPSDKDKAKLQLRLLSNQPVALAPMTSAAKSDALLKAPQRPTIPKNKDELDAFQRKRRTRQSACIGFITAVEHQQRDFQYRYCNSKAPQKHVFTSERKLA